MQRAGTALRRAVVAAANRTVKAWPLSLWLPWLALIVLARDVRADASARSFADAEILDSWGMQLHLESITTRLSAFEQNGTGYQSQAGSVLGPGSERLTVFEPQLEIVATQGDRLRHRLWLPLDVLTQASPNSISRGRPDIVSGASRHLESGTIDWSTTYRQSAVLALLMRGGIHLENPVRSWNAGLGASRAFDDQNTVVTAGVLGVLDWFDKFYVDGSRHGRTQRSTTTADLGLTQILTTTTVANMNYGLSVQEGELGNTWNSVPLASHVRGPELLPTQRGRHALVARIAQFLPWNGALRGYYRFYADDWGIVAHSIEGQLMQRLTPILYIGGLYRFHTQTGPYFFTTLAPVDQRLRTADSDLAPLQSNTIGGKIVGDVPVTGAARVLHFEVEYDRYFRSNELTMNIATCAIGFRF